jgi:hypothetical protein
MLDSMLYFTFLLYKAALANILIMELTVDHHFSTQAGRREEGIFSHTLEI